MEARAGSYRAAFFGLSSRIGYPMMFSRIREKAQTFFSDSRRSAATKLISLRLPNPRIHSRDRAGAVLEPCDRWKARETCRGLTQAHSSDFANQKRNAANRLRGCARQRDRRSNGAALCDQFLSALASYSTPRPDSCFPTPMRSMKPCLY